MGGKFQDVDAAMRGMVLAAEDRASEDGGAPGTNDTHERGDGDALDEWSGTSDLGELVRRARQGDAKAARDVIESAAHCLLVDVRYRRLGKELRADGQGTQDVLRQEETGRVLPPRLADALGGALVSILHGVDPSFALGLKASHRPPSTNQQSVKRAIAAMHRLVIEGVAPEDAAAKVLVAAGEMASTLKTPLDGLPTAGGLVKAYRDASGDMNAVIGRRQNKL